VYLNPSLSGTTFYDASLVVKASGVSIPGGRGINYSTYRLFFTQTVVLIPGATFNVQILNPAAGAVGLTTTDTSGSCITLREQE